MKTEETPEDVSSSRYANLDYTSPPVLIITGDLSAVHAEFFVHQHLICPRSELIARSLRDLQGNSKEREVILPDCDPEVVSQYIKLLYTERLPPKDSNIDAITTPDKYLVLSKLYVLAEKLIDRTTQRTVLDELYARGQERDGNGMHEQPSLLTIRTIYSSTKIDSEMRAWLVDLYASHISVEAPFNVFPVARDFPQELLADLVARMITFCPLPAQLTSTKKELAEAKTHAQAHLKAKLQLGAQFAKAETQLKDKLAQTEEELRKKTAAYEGASKDLAMVNKQRKQLLDSKAALEEDLRKARAEVVSLKRRPESTGMTSVWDRSAPDMYRNR